MAEVWHQPPVSQGKLLVLLALADNADEETRRAWPSVKTLARKTVLSERQVQYCLKALADAGVIEILPNAGPSGTNVYHIYEPSEWGGAKTAGVQPTSPGGEPDCTGGVQSTSPGGVQPIAPEPSIRTIKEPSKNHQSARDEIAEAVSAYNAVAEETGWPEVQVINPKRRAALTQRLKEAGGLDGWLAALAKAQASPFCCGQNKTGWRANFDFLTQQSSFAKLMEGNYDARTPAKRSSLETGFARAVAARAAGG